MKGVRFYEEYDSPGDKRKGRGAGNVTAAFVNNGVFYSGGEACYDALSGIYSSPDSPVASTGVSLTFLSVYCKRVSEARAREVHPALFEQLDDDEGA